MPKCAICGNELDIKKTRELADGTLICRGCYEYSPMVVECEDCGEKFHAANALRIDSEITCIGCLKKSIRKNMDYHSWKDWERVCDEDEEEATVEGWLEWHEDAWAETPERDIYKKTMRGMLAEELEKIKRAA